MGNTEDDLDNINSKLNSIQRQVKALINNNVTRNGWRDIWLPLFSAIIALTGVLSGIWIQRNTLNAQIEMNEFQATFLAKQTSYANFMVVTDQFIQITYNNEEEKIDDARWVIVQKFLELEPFLSDEAASKIDNQIGKFLSACLGIWNLELSEKRNDDQVKVCMDQREEIRIELRQELFMEMNK